MRGTSLFKYGLLSLICALLTFQIMVAFSCGTDEPFLMGHSAWSRQPCCYFNHPSACFYFGPRFTFPFRPILSRLPGGRLRVRVREPLTRRRNPFTPGSAGTVTRLRSWKR